MSFRLACADFAFPLLPHDNVLDLIAALRFEGVDIGLFEGRSHLWPSREFAQLAKSARLLGRKLADRGLQAADRVSADGTGLRPVRRQSSPSVPAAQGARLVPQDARVCGRLRGTARDHVAGRVLPRRAALGVVGSLL